MQFKVTRSRKTPIGAHHPKVPIEESGSWPTLHAGSRVSYTPKSSGPWTIYFVVQGKGITVTTESPEGRLMLMRSGTGFHVRLDGELFQAPGARQRMEAAFNASPEELGRAAVEAARRKR
ncbi:MAG: hypothetical protein ACJ76N_19110 [Thermoanaerobaculia bacterium]